MASFHIHKLILVLIFLIWLSPAGFCGWTKMDVGTLAWLHSIYFADDRHGWISGGNGTLLSTVDGGASWKKEKMPTADAFRDVYFTDLLNGWILCERSVYDSERAAPSYILRTANGGKSWQKMEFDGGSERLARFFFDGKGTGFAIGEGGAVLRMQSGGSEWKRFPLPVRYLMLDGTFTDGGNGLIAGGGGAMLSTSDGGTTWSAPRYIEGRPGPKINAVWFSGTKNGWAAGDAGKIYHTDDGGGTWTEQPTGVAGDLFDIAFADPANGFAVGENGSILRSGSTGSAWTADAPEGKRHRLEKIAFAGKTVFIVGFGGTVLTTEIEPKTVNTEPDIKGKGR